MNQDLITVKVARKVPEAQDIARFELVAMDGGALPAFTAGAHVSVHLGSGLIRHYSLCNSPEETHRYVLGVLRERSGRGGSACMHDEIHEGATLQIGLPRNQFVLDEHAGFSLLLAGGIGITPLLAMAERLRVLGKPFDLRYCNRSRERAAFLDRLDSAAFGQCARLHCDDGGGAGPLNLDDVLQDTRRDAHIYVCGPGGFIDHVLDRARAAGWAQPALHSERFTADVTSQAPGSTAFEVQVGRAGPVIPVAADQSVVAALHLHGIEIAMSCEQGVCGTCLTRVLEGEVEHRDSYLTDAERAQGDIFLPCCSRARSARLVIAP